MYSFYRKVHTFNLNILVSEAVRIRCLWPACYIRRPCLKIQKGKGSLNIHLLHRWGAVMILLLCSSTSHECQRLRKSWSWKKHEGATAGKDQLLLRKLSPLSPTGGAALASLWEFHGVILNLGHYQLTTHPDKWALPYALERVVYT